MTQSPFLAPSTSAMVKNLRLAFGVGGLISAVFGVLILVWPQHTAMAVVGVFVALWTLFAGLGSLAVGIFGSAPGRQRILYLVLGALFFIGGIVAWANLGVATEILAITIGVVVGLVWIIEGAVALFTSAGAGPWPVIYGVVSVLAGVVLLLAPFLAAALLWLWLGISLLVVGVVQIVRAIRFGR